MQMESVIQTRVPEVVKLTPFVSQEAIVRSPRGVSGLAIKGLPLSDTALIARKRIIAGHDLSVPTPGDSLDQILISKATADELHTTPGKAIAAIRFNERMQTREDLLRNYHRFRIAGVFETGMTEYDAATAYITLDAAQRFAYFSPTEVSGYEMMTTSIGAGDSVTKKLNRLMHYPYFAESIYTTHQAIFAWIELQKQPIPIILGLIMIVATFNVVSTLLLIVVEKTHSIGVLRAIGVRAGGIRDIFLHEGLIIACAGIVAGDLFAFVLCWLEAHYQFLKLQSDIYFMSSVPIALDWHHYAIVSAIAFVLSVAATYIPARIASRMTPLNALRFR